MAERLAIVDPVDPVGSFLPGLDQSIPGLEPGMDGTCLCGQNHLLLNHGEDPVEHLLLGLDPGTCPCGQDHCPEQSLSMEDTCGRNQLLEDSTLTSLDHSAGQILMNLL